MAIFENLEKLSRNRLCFASNRKNIVELGLVLFLEKRAIFL